ncbi:MAG: hypothetical protein JWP74_3308 [Marmoricola sp.]|nr:hypothetical protein [Marmoricola sp.]
MDGELTGESMTRHTRRRGSVLCAALALLVSACGGSALPTTKNVASTQSPSAQTVSLTGVAMARPGLFIPPLHSPDILVQSQDPLPLRLVDRAKGLKGVGATVQFSLATFYNQENAITYAAVNPATFRNFTPGPTAELDVVWDRVADGEMAIEPDLKQTLAGPGDYATMGNDAHAQRVHIAAYAPLIDRSKIGALVNQNWASRLHMPVGNALLVSTGNAAPEGIQKKLAHMIGKRGTATLLAPNLDTNTAQTAVLTGGSVSQAVGSFTYTANKDGTVNPDPTWIRNYIRTEQVPIIGDVTCNKGMLPQLREALHDVIRAGLTAEIHPSQYGGCYVPRYIANDPSKGLSFHTFGTAIDLNVPENERGTVGKMNRQVVAIFENCGFTWGGTWSYTDPMHFELNSLRSC